MDAIMDRYKEIGLVRAELHINMSFAKAYPGLTNIIVLMYFSL